ncbi:MAG: lysine--tRNA ligase, partial [Actinomycetota bacterium]
MNDDTTQNAAPAVNLAAFRERRLEEIAALKSRGINPYPYRFDRSHTLGEIRAAHGSLAAGTETTELVAVCGRIMRKRDQGKRIFITVRDRNDERQRFVSKSGVG